MSSWFHFGSNEPSSKSISEISVQELKERLDRESTLLLIDVRTLEEYENGRAPHVKARIEYQVIAAEIDATQFPKDQPIYLICRAGRRSMVAARELADCGYLNLINIKGGMNDWIKSHFPVIKR
ncbi:MAG: rhodanese-like domain-containing protein [bacterium]|nr:rhodanese-like domain-containing protein [bacterium]